MITAKSVSDKFFPSLSPVDPKNNCFLPFGDRPGPNFLLFGGFLK